MGFIRSRSMRTGLLVLTAILAFPTSALSAKKESLVLMPLRTTGVDSSYNAPMESALAEGLSGRYKVYAGIRVADKVKEIFAKVSRETAAGETCDDTKCLQNVAIEFQAELVSNATILKNQDGFFLTLNIVNVLEDVVVFSKSEICKGCDEFQVIAKLKAMAGAGDGVSPPPAPEMQIQKGGLKANSTPTGAEVIVENKQGVPVFKGVTPFEADLVPDEYKIIFTLEYYQPLEVESIVKSGKTTSIGRDVAILQKMQGALKVTSNPPGVDVTISNKKISIKNMTTPFTIQLDFGKYKMQLSKNGYTSLQLNVGIPPGGTVEVGEDEARLKKQEGTVNVYSDPFVDDAPVFVDELPKGAVPVELVLPSGTYLIRVEDEYIKGESRVVVDDESSQELFVPVKGKLRLAGSRIGLAGGAMKIGPASYWAPLSDLYFPVYGFDADILHGVGREQSPVHLSLGASTGTLKAKTAEGDKFTMSLNMVNLDMIYEGQEQGGFYGGVSFILVQLDYTNENRFGTTTNENASGSVYAGEVGYIGTIYNSMKYKVSYLISNEAKLDLGDNRSGISLSRIGVTISNEW